MLQQGILQTLIPCRGDGAEEGWKAKLSKDYTKLNDIPMKDVQTLPFADDTREASHGVQWFTNYCRHIEWVLAGAAE